MNILGKILLMILLFSSSFSYFFDLNFVSNYVLPATILAVSAGLGIMWMLSDMMANPELKAKVKMEVRSMISGGVLLVIVSALFFGANSTASILTGEPDVNSAASAQLDNFIQPLAPAFNDLVDASHYIGMMMGFGYSSPTNLWYASLTFVAMPHSGVRGLNSMIVSGAGAISGAIFIYSAINVLLEFFTAVVPYVILPLAFSLRFIPFTKKIGNTLIALCIGASLVFPVAVILTGYFHELAFKNIDPPDLNMGPFKSFHYPAVGWFCSDSDNPIVDVAKSFVNISDLGWGLIIGLIWCLATLPACAFMAGWNFAVDFLFPMLNLVWQALFWVVALIDYNAFFGDVDAGGMYDSLANFLEITIYHVFMAYIDALMVIIITIVTTKSISGAIGGEAYLAGIQRFVG
ncbi:MAG: hypothetical protein PHU63_01740 [Candidatus ainarchaeum sp.]|nr:hypothetical protein [Candidatus ainarchaeum sp.]